MDLNHWISVEIPSDAGNTACIHVNMATVQSVAFIREGSTDKILSSLFQLKDFPKEIGLQGKAAQFFHDRWMDYLNVAERLVAVQPKEEPSLIHRVSGKNHSNIISQIN